MTPEQRLDRLERIAKLFVKAGLRGRREARRHDEKINILIDAQILNEERFAQLEESVGGLNDKMNILVDTQIRNEERLVSFQIQNEERIAKSDSQFGDFDARFAKLAESQADTDRKLKALIEIIRRDRNGNASGSL